VCQWTLTTPKVSIVNLKHQVLRGLPGHSHCMRPAAAINVVDCVTDCTSMMAITIICESLYLVDIVTDCTYMTRPVVIFENLCVDRLGRVGSSCTTSSFAMQKTIGLHATCSCKFLEESTTPSLVYKPNMDMQKAAGQHVACSCCRALCTCSMFAHDYSGTTACALSLPCHILDSILQT